MGYELHITRRAEWFDHEGPDISLEEWNAYVATDPEVQPDPDNGPEDFLIVTDPGNPSPLWWFHGELRTKHPSDPTIQKMIRLAKALKAKVLGDDGEEYS